MKRMENFSRGIYADILVIPMNDELKINTISINCGEQRVQPKSFVKCSPYATFKTVHEENVLRD